MLKTKKTEKKKFGFFKVKPPLKKIEERGPNIHDAHDKNNLKM